MNALQALVVTSDISRRAFFRTALEACGIDCHEAHDGIDALKLASDYGIDLVVTALTMPRLDGLELLELTRRGVFGNNPPPIIICISSPAEHDVVQHRGMRDCSGVLSPSATREQVIEVVFAALDGE